MLRFLKIGATPQILSFNIEKKTYLNIQHQNLLITSKSQKKTFLFHPTPFALITLIAAPKRIQRPHNRPCKPCTILSSKLLIPLYTLQNRIGFCATSLRPCSSSSRAPRETKFNLPVYVCIRAISLFHRNPLSHRKALLLGVHQPFPVRRLPPKNPSTQRHPYWGASYPRRIHTYYQRICSTYTAVHPKVKVPRARAGAVRVGDYFARA